MPIVITFECRGKTCINFGTKNLFQMKKNQYGQNLWSNFLFVYKYGKILKLI